MSLAMQLWEENQDLATAALRHPFVRGLADGTLPRSSFAGYVAQDAFFLESFARAYALALAHSPDRHGIDAFADLIAGVREELRLHAGYAQQWEIDLATVEPEPATLEYTDFLWFTASEGDAGLTCAAMVPCMRLYAYLGQQLAAAGGAGAYAEWVRTYADPAFEELASRLEALLDRYVEDSAQARKPYRRAMQLELGFFDGAYAGGEPGTPA